MSFSKAFASFKLNVDLPNSHLLEEQALELEQVISEQRAHSEHRRLMSLKDKADRLTSQKDMAELSAEEQLKAAEAVVDAAICVQSLGKNLGISPETRAFLVDAVLQDPSLTPKLFTEDFHHFMRS